MPAYRAYSTVPSRVTVTYSFIRTYVPTFTIYIFCWLWSCRKSLTFHTDRTYKPLIRSRTMQTLIWIGLHRDGGGIMGGPFLFFPVQSRVFWRFTCWLFSCQSLSRASFCSFLYLFVQNFPFLLCSMINCTLMHAFKYFHPPFQLFLLFNQSNFGLKCGCILRAINLIFEN